jgi:hypothetical protein
MESSSEDSSEEGPDVYVPSFSISSRSISFHEKPENSDSNDQKQFDDHLDILKCYGSPRETSRSSSSI